MANALIAYPLSLAETNYTLRVSIDTVEQNLNFGGSGMTVGRYYWLTGDGQADADGGVGGVGDLLAMLATCCNLHTSASAVTVSLSTDLRVVVSIGSGSIIQLLWSHASTTLDPAIFGFNDASTSTAASITGDYQPQGLWAPGKPVRMGPRPTPPIVGGVSRSISGRTRVSYFGQQGDEWPLMFDMMLPAVVLDEYASSSAPTGTLQTAWQSALARGRPFRVFENVADVTLADYRLMRITSHDEPWERGASARRWRAQINAAEVEA